MKLSVFSSGLELLSAAEEERFDLYVLDVVMPGLSGIDLGLKLRELGSYGAIVYLSISPEYAVDSYAARAFYYLMKPVESAKLFHVLDQAAASLEKRRASCVTVKTSHRASFNIDLFTSVQILRKILQIFRKSFKNYHFNTKTIPYRT